MMMNHHLKFRIKIKNLKNFISHFKSIIMKPRVTAFRSRIRPQSKPTIRLKQSTTSSFVASFIVFIASIQFTSMIVISQGLLSSSSISSTTLTTEPYRTQANLGENVILRCVFDFPEGYRVPYVIQWEKKGVKIPIYIWYDGYHPHIGEGYENRVSLSGRASLNLTNVRDTDQGWYECKVFFLNRPPEPIKNGTWVHLDVLAPPQFRIKPPDVIYVKIGESITLPCETYGTPTPQIMWYKDNKPLKSNSNVHIYNHELQIDNIQSSDIGEYRCTSHNHEGTINAITKIIIAGPAVITIPPPQNTTKLQGDRVELICEARALPSNFTYRWFHDGQEIGHVPWQESRFIIKPGMLIINPSVAEDSGLYTCEVSNGIGSPDTASAYLNIEFPARVYYSPTIQYLPLGLSGIVRCFIQASPPFQFVTWTKDRRPFDPNSTPDVSTLNNGSLLFHKVNLEHQGIYRCTPYNVHGTAESSQPMEVLVRDPPVFTRKPKDQYVRAVNDEISITCDGNGQPKPNIYWRKADGTKLLPRERITINAGNITIKLLKKEDHGHYQCVLENEIAAITADTLIIINNTTPHTPTNVSVNASYFAATIRWQPNYNGGYEQTFYLSYRISDQGDSEWKTIRVPPPETTNTFTLYNLQSDNEYEFQVYATNRLGSGQPSQIVRASTKPWSFGEKIYPTDASGATYIPTVQKPSGPKPDAPRNLTFQRMAQGWVLSWHPPLNVTVAVAYYRVEYRKNDDEWLYTDPIPYDTAYLFDKLESNSHYIFRVWAYSILGVGEVSHMIEVNLDEYYDGHTDTQQQHFHAMIASIIGGFIFFSMSIVLILCLVKICNRKKRRKIEKSYVMVTCPVNGNVCFNESSLSSKQQYVPYSDSIIGQQYYNDKYYRDYWQRSTINNESSSSAAASTTIIHRQQQQQQLISNGTNNNSTDEYDGSKSQPSTTNVASTITKSAIQSQSSNTAAITIQPQSQSPLSYGTSNKIDNANTFANIHVSYGHNRKFQHSNHDDDTTAGQSQQQQINRFESNNASVISHSGQYRPESTIDQPQSIDSSIQQQFSALCKSKFQSRSFSMPRRRNPVINNEQISMMIAMDHDHDVRNRSASTSMFQPPSMRGSFRSDGSGQSQIGRPFSQQSFNHNGLENNQIITDYPSDYLFRPVQHNLNSDHLSDSISIISNSVGHQHLQPQHHHHHHYYYHHSHPHSCHHFHQTNADECFYHKQNQMMSDSEQMRELPSLKSIHNCSNQPFNRSNTFDNSNLLRATVPMMQRNWILSKRPKLEPVPEAIYDYSTIHKQHTKPLELPPRASAKYTSPYQNLPIPRHLLVKTIGPKPKKPPTKPEEISSPSSTSSPTNGGYTRDKLLGAVEKVRSGQFLSINRDSPFRHSFEGGYLTNTYQVTSSQNPQVPQAAIPQPPPVPPPPPRKNAKYDQPSNTYIQNDSPGHSSGISIDEHNHHGINQNYSADDEIYELQNYNHGYHQRTKSNPMPISNVPPKSSQTTLKSSLQYYSYRAPKNMSIQDIERRCRELRQEFLHFRQRQAQLNYGRLSCKDDNELNIQMTPSSSSSSSSSSSDGFESLC